MGILDEAIRDHLELMRKGGTREADLRRLEDEAFGPPGRPGEPAPGVAAPAQAPEVPEPQDQPPQRPEQEAAVEAPEVEREPDGRPEPEGQVLFHDFAAEEGLVPPRGDAAPAPPVEEAEEEAPAPPPTDEISFDDTQAHDMESEIGVPEEQPETTRTWSRRPGSRGTRRSSRGRSTRERPKRHPGMRVRTCSRRRRTSFARRPSTTACGSSRSRRRTSTSTTTSN